MASDNTNSDRVFPKGQSNGWTENKQLVLHELKRLNTGLEKLETKLDDKHSGLERRLTDLHTEVVTLKIKSRTWGAIGGGVLGFIAAVLVKVFG